MPELHGARIILRDKHIDDAELDYIWRSDPELARLDAAYPLTMTYDRFLKIYQDQLKYPTPALTTSPRLPMRVSSSATACTMTLTASTWKPSWASSSGTGTTGVRLRLRRRDDSFGIPVQERNLKRVYLHTLEWNERAQRCFSRCGFQEVRRVRRMAYDFILMEVKRDDWLADAEHRLISRWSYREESSGKEPPSEQTPGE